MTDIEIMQVLIKAKELGITQEDVDAFKIVPRGDQVEYVPDLSAEQLVKPRSPLDDMTDEEILFYATPYFDELQAKKELQKAHKATGEVE